MVMQKEETWGEVLSALPCGCLLVDPQGVVLAANRSAIKLLGLSSPFPTGSSLWDLVPSWKECAAGIDFSTLESRLLMGEPVEVVCPIPQGGYLRVCVTLLSARAEDRPCFLLTLIDVTEAQRLKEQLRQAEYQASIGKLARGIAHELSNPLDGVLRYTQLALEQINEETPLREYLIHVKEGLDRMVRAVKTFLEFSRQATAPVYKASPLNQLVEDALLLVHHRAKFQQIRIVRQFEESLPEVCDSGLVYAVVNLVKNAFDAMPQGGTMMISTRRNGSGVDLTIEDTGSGIPEAIRPRIFEPFFTTKPIHQGSGLGLLIAKEVVERSGGTIDFTIREEGGTRFRIRVPLAPPSAGASGA